ncbi:sugar transferase [Rheinheimera mesophila]|uniref:Sugar transferase n=1 Tax=Rheinheimera mesophila TaxID=1547515 RepID=A0A3P3QPF3_9GAMM|nr:sugar transferase [Rheinheimera mesophila]KKL00426.1 sugar transferase [Rheinheimera mesophila]RRJ23132.1 sugar transferase [Rheinheimera mesophila]
MKRIFDIVASFLAIILLSPFIILVGCLIRIKLGKPVFFMQERPGLAGKSFNLIKFRSMLNLTDKNGVPLSDARRLTRFGKILRSTSVDELPGLWNVLKGDMSLVGPRPLLVEYLPLYSEQQARRHEVRPGITGWAQVNGRNAISWEEKFEMDVWYVDNRTFWLDLKIIFLTIKKVFLRKDISAVGEATVSKFTGSYKN